MSEVKHTPGPWFSGKIRIGGFNPSFDGCDIGAEDGSNVAVAIHQPNDREQSETIANGRLIAAAPELLEALTKLLGNAIQLNDAGDGWTEITADTQDVQQARAAIAKALGS